MGREVCLGVAWRGMACRGQSWHMPGGAAWHGTPAAIDGSSGMPWLCASPAWQCGMACLGSPLMPGHLNPHALQAATCSLFVCACRRQPNHPARRRQHRALGAERRCPGCCVYSRRGAAAAGDPRSGQHTSGAGALLQWLCLSARGAFCSHGLQLMLTDTGGPTWRDMPAPVRPALAACLSSYFCTCRWSM